MFLVRESGLRFWVFLICDLKKDKKAPLSTIYQVIDKQFLRSQNQNWNVFVRSQRDSKKWFMFLVGFFVLRGEFNSLACRTHIKRTSAGFYTGRVLWNTRESRDGPRRQSAQVPECSIPTYTVADPRFPTGKAPTLEHRGVRTRHSDWYENSFIMVVYEKFF